MRIIAGTARSLPLKTIDGLDTRPTTDRIKETLFNMLTPYLYDCIFLDLFAGSGGIGIEALSRGAMKAYFVDNNPNAIACIKENLKHTRLFQKGETMPVDVLTALKRLEGNQQFDFIFMDAAKGQYMHFLPDVLRLLAPGGLLISDNVLQEGNIIESRYAVCRRDRTIHARMREYLYTLTHHDELETVVLPVGDGATLSVKLPEKE